MKKAIGTFLLAFTGAALGFGVMQLVTPKASQDFASRPQPVLQVNQLGPSQTEALKPTELPSFVQASAIATPAVVHIRSLYGQASANPLHGFFGNGQLGAIQPQSTGSGVIISDDGYIATNNHVVKNAERVEVTLEDKRSYEAEVVGTDPTTDLALLKIDETQLHHLSFANSNDLMIGEWVLAVGNPFNLTSTVTAGIVSAKGRNLNLLNEDFAIESFIQTDAAVNPGNSGGALINTRGELVGINTAIASETGSYAGYSFAVPVNIVHKVMEDLREYGEVQRGIIGVQIRNINAQLAEKYGLKTLDGAYVTGTIEGGAAQAAGIKPGDIITRVNDTPIKGSSELQEEIGTYHPGDKVHLTIIRNGNTQQLDVVLRNREGKTTLSPQISEKRDEKQEEDGFSSRLGAKLEAVSPEEMNTLGLDNGVKVVKLKPGKLQSAGLEEGFVILKVNKQPVSSPKEVERHVAGSADGVLIEGLTAEGKKRYYAFE